MTDEELWVSLFSGQGRGGAEAKRSWMGVVYIALILTLHIPEIKHNSQLQTFQSNHYRIPILLLSIFAMQNEHGQGVSHAISDSKVPEKVQEKAPQGLGKSLLNKVRVVGARILSNV